MGIYLHKGEASAEVQLGIISIISIIYLVILSKCEILKYFIINKIYP